MKFPSPLLKGILVRRYRRSLADIKLENGTVVTAHVFGTGPLTGCSTPGSTVMISDSGDRSRKNPMTWELVEVDGTWVGVNPKLSRLAVLEALSAGEIEMLKGYTLESGLAGRSRTSDLVLHGMNDNCFVGLESVSVGFDGTALVPDGDDRRSRLLLERLTGLTGQGHRTLALFHVLRPDCTELRIATDSYGRMLSEARDAGVELRVYRASVSPEEVTLGAAIPLVIDQE